MYIVLNPKVQILFRRYFIIANKIFFFREGLFSQMINTPSLFYFKKA